MNKMDKRYSIATISEALDIHPATLKRKCYEAHILYGYGLTMNEIEYVINREERRAFNKTVDVRGVDEIKSFFKEA